MRTAAVILMALWPLHYALAQNAATAGSGAANGQSPEEIFNSVFSLYESGHIAEAEHTALKVLDTRDDLTKIERARFYVLLAFCAIANDEEENGTRRFGQALGCDPGIVPDLVTWSPKIRRVFDQAYRQFLAGEESRRSLRAALTADICRRASLKCL
jgi:hypothetical protein